LRTRCQALEQRLAFWSTYLCRPHISHVLFVIDSRDHTAFAFDASTVRCRQEGLYVINTLPWRSRRLNLFVAVYVAGTIAENFADRPPNYQLRLGLFLQQRIVVIDARGALNQ
jgi:hypothetical protein